MWFLLSLASAQTFTGGFGVGALAGIFSAESIQRPGFVTTASIEIQQFTDELPGFGAGIEGELGFAPKYCTRCVVTPIGRLGIGPIFRRRRSFTMVGIRASMLGQRRNFRPYAMSKMQVPVAGMVFRPFVWIEGFRATEAGVGLEIGFKIAKDGRLIIREAPPGKRKTSQTEDDTSEETVSEEPMPPLP